MRYIIMADGEGKRWGNYLGIPKHLIEIDGEPIIKRTVRLLKENGIKDEDIFITSRDERYVWAQRVLQTVRDCEIDRFEESIVNGPVCYMYGDVYYTEDAMKTIVNYETDDIMFFGSDWEIYAIKAQNIKHFLKEKNKVKNKYIKGEINRCIGWEIYRSIYGLLLEDEMDFEKHIITDGYVKILDETFDFDTPEDYDEWIELYNKK